MIGKIRAKNCSVKRKKKNLCDSMWRWALRKPLEIMKGWKVPELCEKLKCDELKRHIFMSLSDGALPLPHSRGVFLTSLWKCEDEEEESWLVKHNISLLSLSLSSPELCTRLSNYEASWLPNSYKKYEDNTLTYYSVPVSLVIYYNHVISLMGYFLPLKSKFPKSKFHLTASLFFTTRPLICISFSWP